MKISELNFRKLDQNGYVVEVEPQEGKSEPSQSISVSFYVNKYLGSLDNIQMIRIYHHRMIVIPVGGGYIEYVFRRGGDHGEALISSTGSEKVCYLMWDKSFTSMVRGNIVSSEENGESLNTEETIVFVGQDHGKDEVIVVEGEVDENHELYAMLPHYADHCKRMLEKLKE